MSIAGFIEGGYTHSFNHLFGIYGTIGLGYGVSVIEDFAPALSWGKTVHAWIHSSSQL